MASIDGLIEKLTTVRESLSQAREAAVAAAELTREVQDQLMAMGAHGVADRFTPVLDKIEKATARLAAGLAATEEAIALAEAAKGGAYSGGFDDQSRADRLAPPGEGAPRLGQGGDPPGGDRAEQGRDAAAVPAPPPALPAARVSALLATLPVFGGRGSKTRGTFVGPDGRDEPLLSGENAATKATAARVGLANVASAETHVEAHAANAMRQRGIDRASLVLNQRPCPGMYGCDVLLPRLLPPGAQLTVYGPNGFQRTYTGREANTR